MKNPAYSPDQWRQMKRREVASLIHQAFGGPGATQKAVAQAARKLTGTSERQVINYLHKEHDAPAWFVDMIRTHVIAKTERLARRIEGGQ